MKENQQATQHAALAADIVAAYVSNNSVPAAELPALIQAVHISLMTATVAVTDAQVEQPQEPAVPIKKSVTDDYIICLEDGKKFKSLKQHLSTAYGTTPAAYRAKWGLPYDYPMVAPAYAAQRSMLAKKIGLGASRKRGTAPKRKPVKKAA